MCRRRAFTLIELLVVIAVVSLLMAILVPVLGKVRRQARAVACRANLRQWATTLALYLEDNEGHLPHDQYGTWWVLTGRTFTERRNGRVVAPREYHPISTKGMLCPEATRPSELATGGGVWGFGGQSWRVERYLGCTFEAWKLTITGAGAPLVGSYGLNGRLFLPPGDPEEVSRPIVFLLNDIRSYTDVFSMRGRNAIPLLLDCVTVSGAPTQDSRPPHAEPKPGQPSSRSNSPMANFCINRHSGYVNFCINRHSGYVNCLFLDWSVRKVGLKELWTLKWHKDFNTANSWTTAGGVQPEDWPEWMRKFKNY